MGKTTVPVPAWLVMSDITSRPYIDESRQAYAFSSEDAAEEFAEKVGKAYVRVLDQGMDVGAMSECYAAGAGTLIELSGRHSSRHTLEAAGLVRRYYNPDLNADVSRYISTRRMEYIGNMRMCRFIVPVRISNHPQMSVMYATAVFPDTSFWYLAFTDLEEYEKGSVVEINASNVDRFLHYRDTSRDFSNEGRMERQKAYIMAAADQILENLTSDPQGSWSKIQQMEEFIQTDITRSQYLDLVNDLKGIKEIEYITPEGTLSVGRKYNEFYPDQESVVNADS